MLDDRQTACLGTVDPGPMKAVFIEQYEGPERLTYGDRPELEVGPGEVMLQVCAGL